MARTFTSGRVMGGDENLGRLGDVLSLAENYLNTNDD